MDMGRLAWLLFGACALYMLVAVVLPIAARILTSFQRFATALLHQAQWTLANYETALALGPVREALVNSLMLFFFQAEDGIRDGHVTGVQTCALPISPIRQGTGKLIRLAAGPLLRMNIPTHTQLRRLSLEAGGYFWSNGSSVQAMGNLGIRSEERRVGKECRSQRSTRH